MSATQPADVNDLIIGLLIDRLREHLSPAALDQLQADLTALCDRHIAELATRMEALTRQQASQHHQSPAVSRGRRLRREAVH